MLKNEEGDVNELEKQARKEVEELKKLVDKVKLPDFDRVLAGKW
jgi:hypothetical protein